MTHNLHQQNLKKKKSVSFSKSSLQLHEISSTFIFFFSEFCLLGSYTCCETVKGIKCIITCGGQSVLEELDNTTLSRHSVLREIVQEKSKRSFYGSHSYYHQCGWQNVKLFPDQYKFRTEAWQTDKSIYSLKATIKLTFIVNLSPTHWNHRTI